MVLIARIAIESGRGQASLFTMALAGVTSLAVFRFVPDSPWVTIACLAIIWWCADKLTWDCTLIDETEDASGEGLLQVAGVADEAELPAEAGFAVPSEASAGSTTDASSADSDSGAQRVPLWKRLFSNTAEREGKPHAPGLWVVYFSLAALPIFGFGQTAIRASDTAARQFAFYCLLAYVASGLGLLLLTSFLGLRRYLRQRNLQMPASMAATWIGVGGVIAVAILAACLVLPRPDAQYDITAMIDQMADGVQEASDRAFFDEDGAEGEGQQGREADPNAEQGAASDPNQQGKPGGQEPGQQTAQNGGEQRQGQDQQGGKQDGQGGGSKQPDDQQGSQQQAGNEQQGSQQNRNGQQTAQNNQADGQQSGENPQNDRGEQAGNAGRPPENQQTAQNDNNRGEAGDRQRQQNGDNNQANANRQVAQNEQNENGENADESSAEGSTPEPESPDLSSAMSMIGALFKWLVYAILIAIALYVAWRNRVAVMNFLQNLWNEFLSLFGRKPVEAAAEEEESAEPAVPRVPFASFRNPFATGAFRKHSPAELVRYSFEALQAWAFEHGVGRSPDQTPIEFGQQLRLQKVPCGAEANELGQLYAQVAYAGYRPDDQALPVLERLWRKLQ